MKTNTIPLGFFQPKKERQIFLILTFLVPPPGDKVVEKEAIRSP